MIVMGSNGVTVLVGTSGEQGPLLDPETLLEAVRGNLVGGSPLVEGARQLGCLYREWIVDRDAGQRIQAEIGMEVGTIDAWISGQLPHPLPGVPRATESVGGVIARVAEASECAHWALHHLGEPERHRAWDHLAEIHQGYEDLVRQVMAGLIVLPKSWPGIRWPGIHSISRAERPVRGRA
ncbi:hypothetical protein [Nocardia pseudovaccinii]|uniref:hypothetical protein n=1 Tax=Nocardia pseudovaccinii TaxID=189540 RepID=UPI000A561367|nr:hypothetical protein [Nocardia pseudovaccinii]